jgi:hypothetical protein
MKPGIWAIREHEADAKELARTWRDQGHTIRLRKTTIAAEGFEKTLFVVVCLAVLPPTYTEDFHSLPKTLS